ncbi:hypothetical protein PHET_03438 [Paragonimus heterotremus]|uniref:Uncharacterized protein n=1 Tax=Paragonimus heterotremus TaxID=100268 RepID=A0A8J4TEB2_9TREM|nr:hypothetical protein PHET_03438 [Paragonimus heterotremus]
MHYIYDCSKSHLYWYVFPFGLPRCPPALRIFLRILESSLLASRSYWTHRLLERVVPLTTSVSTFGSNSTTLSSAMRPAASPSHNGSDSHLESPLTNCPGITAVSAPQASNNRLTVFTDEECERLCANMLLTQNATVVQLLLEYCLPTKQECAIDSEVSVLREIRNILCTYIHYMFIAEPALAEVIVWQVSFFFSFHQSDRIFDHLHIPLSLCKCFVSVQHE